MKKQLLTIFGIAVLSVLTNTVNAQVTNGNLESWMNFSIYDDPDTNGMLKSLNVIATFPQNPPPTCFKNDTAHTGAYCAKIVADHVSSLSIFVPGVLGTVRPYFVPAIGCKLQTPYVGRPSTFKAWIKYYPVAGDSGEMFSYVLKQNGNNFDTLAVAKKKFLQTINTWTEQSVNFTYQNTTDLGTHLSLVFVTSKAYNFNNLTFCQGSVGSKMYIDDVELIGYNGISEMLFTGEEINVYPNPANSVVNITTTQSISNAQLVIIDMNGREISSQTVNGNQFSVDVNELKAGNYLITLQEGNKILGRKTFIKK